MTNLRERLMRVIEAMEPSWDEQVKCPNHEWSFKRYGALVPDGQSEDGTWDGYAMSGPPRGNITWETEAVPVAVLRQSDVIVPKPLLLALRDIVDELERIDKYGNEYGATKVSSVALAGLDAKLKEMEGV